MSMVFRDGSRTVNAGPWPGGGSQGGGAFRPGQAQPRQPQQQGTPYGQPFNYSQWMQQGQPEGQSQAWQQAGSPENGQQSQTGGFNYLEWLTSPDRHSEQKQAAWRAAGSPRGRPGGGMQSYAQQPGFTQTMQTPYGQMAPSQYYQQRDAFIQTANDQMGQYMANAGTGQSPGAPPQFNMQQMWGQAGQMVEQGWQNPYSQQQAPQQQAPVYSGDFALRRDPNMPSEPPPPGYEWARSKKGTYSLKRVSPGMAQPIPPQSQGTPYGDPGLMMPDPTPWGPAPSEPPPATPPPPPAPAPAPTSTPQDAQREWAANFAKLQQQSLADHNRMMSNMDAWSQSQKRAIDAANPNLRGRRPAAPPPPPPAAPAPKYNAADYKRSDGTYDYTGARKAWNADHAKSLQSQANKNFLAGMSPANRRIYQMMQGMY